MAWSFWSSPTPNEGAKPEPAQKQPTTPPPPPPTSQAPQPEQPPSSTTQTSDFDTAFPHLAPPPPPSSTQATTYDPLLPTTMSCRAAFDNAFYCSSFGGHFNDIYRYGQLRSCSEQWADWRFCMRIKTLSPEGKAEAIQERYREKERKVLEGPNSEDVWKRRGAGEEVERPFGRERVERGE